MMGDDSEVSRDNLACLCGVQWQSRLFSLPHVLIGREEEDVKNVEEGWRSGR